MIGPGNRPHKFCCLSPVSVLCPITGFLAGILLAFVISSFNPQYVLRRSSQYQALQPDNHTKNIAGNPVCILHDLHRNNLIVIQAMNYMIHFKMGFDREQFIMINCKGRTSAGSGIFTAAARDQSYISDSHIPAREYLVCPDPGSTRRMQRLTVIFFQWMKTISRPWA